MLLPSAAVTNTCNLTCTVFVGLASFWPNERRCWPICIKEGLEQPDCYSKMGVECCNLPSVFVKLQLGKHLGALFHILHPQMTRHLIKREPKLNSKIIIDKISKAVF
jgi:hypothetical protein